MFGTNPAFAFLRKSTLWRRETFSVAFSPRGLLQGEDGVTMVEYAMVLALVGVACLASVTALVGAISHTYQTIATALH